MNTNEDIRNDTSEEIIVLGVASVETMGPLGGVENFGGEAPSGISDA